MEFNKYKDLDEVITGTVFDMKPHFISRKNGFGFYLHDKKNQKNIVGFLRGLPEVDKNFNKEYKVIVRGIGLSKNPGEYLAFIEQRVEEGDEIYLQVTSLANKPGYLKGRFAGYKKVFVPRDYNWLLIGVNNYIKGVVEKILTHHRVMFLCMPSIVSFSDYEENKSRIFRHK